MTTPLVVASMFTDIRPGLLVWTWVTFLLVAYLLKRFAWVPLAKAISDREDRITSAMEAARRERESAEKLVAEQAALVAQTRQEASDQVREIRGQMERFREDLMAKAKGESEAMKADARKAIYEERERAVADVRTEAVALSIQIAEKLLGANLDDAKQRQLAQGFVSELGNATTGKDHPPSA